MKNITDIAKMAGVSKSTVSRYLNNGSVSEQTKQLLDQIIQETNYQPNQFAQSLRARRTNLIGAIIPRMNSHAVDETISGVKEACDKHDCQLLLNFTNLDKNLEIEALKMFRRSKVDGIIFMATDITEELQELIEQLGVPVVIVGQNKESFNCVVHDDYRAGQLVGDYIGQQMMSHGTSKLGTDTTSQSPQVQFFGVTEEDYAVGVLRKKGMLNALSHYNIQPNFTLTSFNYREALEDITAHFQQHAITHYDTIVGATDAIALAVYKYCSQYQIPQPWSTMIGFGGDPMTELVSPPIHTVKYQYHEAGKVAIAQLFKALNQQSIQSPQMIDVHFTERES